MLQVADPPLTSSPIVSSVPVTIEKISVGQLTSTAIPPNNLSNKEKAHNSKITTTQYIETILEQNQNWPNRQQAMTNLPRNKVAVNMVSPMPVQVKKDEEVDNDFLEFNPSDFDEFSFDDPPVSNYEVEREAESQPQSQSNAERAFESDTEVAIRRSLEDMRRQAEEQEATINLTNDDVVTEVEDETPPMNADNYNAYEDIDSEEDHHVSDDNDEEDDNNSVDDNINDEENGRNIIPLQVDEDSLFLPSDTIVPLNENFMDQLGHMLEENHPLKEQAAKIKAIDVTGEPIPGPSAILVDNPSQQDMNSDGRDKYNAVYVDLAPVTRMLKRFSSTETEEPSLKKVKNTVEELKQPEEECIKRILNITARSENEKTTCTNDKQRKEEEEKATFKVPMPCADWLKEKGKEKKRPGRPGRPRNTGKGNYTHYCIPFFLFVFCLFTFKLVHLICHLYIYPACNNKAATMKCDESLSANSEMPSLSVGRISEHYNSYS